jgi:hypothetical protein
MNVEEAVTVVFQRLDLHRDDLEGIIRDLNRFGQRLHALEGKVLTVDAPAQADVEFDYLDRRIDTQVRNIDTVFRELSMIRKRLDVLEGRYIVKGDDSLVLDRLDNVNLALGTLWEKIDRVEAAVAPPGLDNALRIAAIKATLAELTSDEECDLDHHGNCQMHNFFGEGECPHAVAKRLIA